MTPGERVREARERKGLSITECERLLELHQGQLTPIERGDRGVSVQAAIRIAERLGVEVEVWRDGPVPAPKPKSRIRRVKA